eukprot:m.105772 g.105772  ORF g.105772 m.105772 type:complete len:964 (+) comp13890_c0_seq2:160-3051(+)
MDIPVDECFHLKHQRVLWDIDIANETVKGETELHIIALKPITEVRLNSRQSRITGVTVNLIQVPYRESDFLLAVLPDNDARRDFGDFREASQEQYKLASQGELVVDLKKNLEKGASVKIQINFELSKPLGGLHFVLPREDFFLDRKPHMFTSADKGEARTFMPCVDNFGDIGIGQENQTRVAPQYPSWELDFTVDSDMVAVCAGTLENQSTLPNNRRLFQYRITTPTPAYNIGFAVGPFEILPDPKLPETTHFCLPGLKNQLAHTIAVHAVAREFAARILDSPFPFGTYQQVFVDEAVAPISSYYGLSILSTSVITSPRIIEKTLDEIRLLLARAVMLQFFSIHVIPKAPTDAWLSLGIAGFLTGLFIEETFGRNEYKYYCYKLHKLVCEEDNVSRPPLMTELHTHVSEYFSTFAEQKSEVVIRMLEVRIGKENLVEIFTQLTSSNEDEGGNLPPLLSTDQFFTQVSDRVPQRWTEFKSNWLERSGPAQLKISFQFNQQSNVMTLNVEQQHDNIFTGDIKVAVQEIDNFVEHVFHIENQNSTVEINLQAKNRHGKRKKVKLENEQDIEINLEAVKTDLPVLWIRLDPDFSWFRKVELEMPAFMWAYEAEHDRSPAAQYEATCQLACSDVKSDIKRLLTVLQKMAINNKLFWRVRARAIEAIPELIQSLQGEDDKVTGFAEEQKTNLIKLFRRVYGIPTIRDLPRPNDFTDIKEYYLIKALIKGIANLKNGYCIAPEGVFEFLCELWVVNDNSENRFDDSYYRGHLLESLAACVGCNPSENASSRMKERFKETVADVLVIITNAMNVDKIAPSFQQAVTCSGLRAIARLQRKKVIPMQLAHFRDHCLYGHLMEVRKVAITILCRTAVRNQADMDFLLELAENDYSPWCRQLCPHILARETYAHMTELKENLKMQKLVERVWSLMNLGSSYEVRLRIAALELFSTFDPNTRENVSGNLKKLVVAL